MCRLFGFRSVVKSQVHTSLTEADNALLHQSSKHPDGWGVAYYLEGAPHVIKSVESAGSDQLFRKVSGLVSSETVLAHLRKATLGGLSITNTHPFQYGSWVFAHNGNIKGFDQYRPKLLKLVRPALSRFILGEADSELIFYVVLSKLEQKVGLSQKDVPIETLVEAVREARMAITNIIGQTAKEGSPPSETFLTFIMTNGRTMVGHHGGQPLLYSTYKSRCPDRDTCQSFSEACEAESKSGFVNHLVLSSESLKGTNIFLPLKSGEMVGVDHRMKLYFA